MIREIKVGKSFRFEGQKCHPIAVIEDPDNKTLVVTYWVWSRKYGGHHRYFSAAVWLVLQCGTPA